MFVNALLPVALLRVRGGLVLTGPLSLHSPLTLLDLLQLVWAGPLVVRLQLVEGLRLVILLRLARTIAALLRRIRNGVLSVVVGVRVHVLSVRLPSLRDRLGVFVFLAVGFGVLYALGKAGLG